MKINNHRVLTEFKLNRLYQHASRVRLEKILEYIFGTEVTNNIYVIHCTVFEKSHKNESLIQNSTLYFSHKVKTGVEHFKNYANHFKFSLIDIEILHDEKGKFKLIVHNRNKYFNEHTIFVLDIYSITKATLINNKDIYRLYDRQIELEQKHGLDKLKKVSSILIPTSNCKSIGYQPEIETIYHHKLGKDAITPNDYFNLNYSIIKKDDYYKKVPNEFSAKAKDYIINTELIVTNEQANCLNSLLGAGLYFYNHNLAKLYCTDKTKFYYEDREWVHQQLKPFIKEGLISLTKIKNSKDRRYTDWVYYENTTNMTHNATNLVKLPTLDI